jgi:hypothetical protein
LFSVSFTPFLGLTMATLGICNYNTKLREIYKTHKICKIEVSFFYRKTLNWWSLKRSWYYPYRNMDTLLSKYVNYYLDCWCFLLRTMYVHFLSSLCRRKDIYLPCSDLSGSLQGTLQGHSGTVYYVKFFRKNVKLWHQKWPTIKNSE